MDDDDYLEDAFREVYLDMCAHGVAVFDPDILAALWADFLVDMAHGFPSLFGTRAPQ